jgi:hypothetical protein
MAKTQADADRITALAQELHRSLGIDRLPWEMLPPEPFGTHAGGLNNWHAGRNLWLRYSHTIYRHFNKTGQLIERLEE